MHPLSRPPDGRVCKTKGQCQPVDICTDPWPLSAFICPHLCGFVIRQCNRNEQAARDLSSLADSLGRGGCWELPAFWLWELGGAPPHRGTVKGPLPGVSGS